MEHNLLQHKFRSRRLTEYMYIAEKLEKRLCQLTDGRWTGASPRAGSLFRSWRGRLVSVESLQRSAALWARSILATVDAAPARHARTFPFLNKTNSIHKRRYMGGGGGKMPKIHFLTKIAPNFFFLLRGASHLQCEFKNPPGVFWNFPQTVGNF